MKNFILITLSIFFGLNIYSQAPEKFTYQSIVRSADGSLLISSDLGIKISILKNSDEGTPVYTETHSVTTNRNGLISLTIGNGVSGDNISDIDWSSGSYYLKVEVDPNGGIGYSIEQTAQLLSVPYALFAGNSSGTDLDKDVTGILPVSKGGTGSSTSPMIAVVTAPNASVARGILGIGEVGGSKVVLKDVTNNYLTLKETNNNSGDQELTAGIVPITLGGTGSTTAPMVGVITAANAAAARAVLEIDASGTDNSTAVTLKDVTDNYLTLSGQEITSGTVPVALGGTGSTTAPMVGVIIAADAAAARLSLGLGTIATQASNAVAISGGAIDGTKIGETTQTTGAFTSVNANTVSAGIFQSSGDTDVTLKTGNATTGNITIANGADGDINISPVGDGRVRIDNILFPSADGTAGQILKTDGSGKLVWESVDVAGTDNSTAVTLADVTDNYLTLSGQEITSGTVPVALGGTGATDAATARTNLGLGTIATQASDAVAISGGAIDGTKIGETTQTTGAFTSVNANTVSAGIFQSSGDTDVTLKTGNATTGNITIANGANGNIHISPNGTGQVEADNVNLKGTTKVAGATLTASAAELNILDGDNSAESVSIASGDRMIINDEGVMKQVTVPVVGNYILSSLTLNSLGDAKTGGTNFTGSILIGHESVANLTADAQYNIGIGQETLQSLTEGDYNIAIGVSALKTNQSGEGNTAIGIEALKSNTTGNYNTALGLEALELNTGDYNTAVGSEALESNTTGSYNTGVGEEVLESNTEGQYNTSVGYKSLATITTQNYNTAVGYKALEDNVENSQTAVGYKALSKQTTGDWNSGFGMEALYHNKTGSANTALGYQSLFGATDNSHEYNTAIGYFTGKDITTGSYNTILGAETMSSNTTGSYNVAVGFRSLLLNLTGGYNTALGYQSMYNSLVDANTAIGYSSMYGNTSGVNNTGLGYWSLWANQTGSNNTAVGKFALQGVTDNSFSNNTAVGYNAGKAITTGTQNIAMGVAALTAITTGSDNTALGFDSLKTVTTGSQNVIIGSGSDASAADGTNQIAIGYGVTGGGNNTVVLGNGDVTAWLPTDTNEVDLGASAKQLKDVYVDGVTYTDALGFGTTAMTLPTADGTDGQVLKTDGSGTLSWTANDSGSGVSAIDDLSDGKSGGTNFNYSMILGHETTGTLNIATGNTAVGIYAMRAITEGDMNTALGYGAFLGLTTGQNNTAIGARAMHMNISGNYNTAVGTYASNNNETGDYNTAIGFEALKLATAGYNTAIGYQAGNVISTGFQNTLIGMGTDPSAHNGNRQIVIGYGATGLGNDTAVIGSDGVTDVYMAEDMGATVHADGVKFYEDTGNGTNYVGFNSANALGGDQVWTLPAADGSANEVLKTDGSGTLSWAANNGSVSAIDDLSDAKSGGAEFTDSMILGHATTGTLSSSQQNVAVGIGAMQSITGGDSNVAVGFQAQKLATTASYNTAVGSNALYRAAGGQNTAVGYQASYANTGGQFNVAVGSEALYLNQNGSQNVAIGRKALYSQTDGDNNTAIGYFAGMNLNGNTSITNGDNNVLIGNDVGVDDANAQNRIVIGQGASGLDDNTVTLGNGDITAWVPADDGEVSLGSSTKEMNDIYVDGVAYTDAIGFGTTAFTLPTSAGSNGQILAKASGANTLEWVNNSGVAGGINELSDGEISGSDNSSVALGTTMGSGNSKRNTALGKDAMLDYSADDAWGHNTAVGYATLKKLTTGNDNTAVGNEIGAHSGSALTGSHNTIVGSQAFLNLTSGSNNTVVGKRASEIVTTGSQNVILGTQADVNSSNANAQNQIVIGYNADGIGDNKAVIGNTSITDVYMAQDGDAVVHSSGLDRGSGSGTDIAGEDLTIKSGAGTGTGAGGSIIFQVADGGASGSSVNSYATAFTIQDNGNAVLAGTLTENSDISLKENIKALPSQLEKIKKLNAVSYNKKATGIKEIGFVAQELEKLFPGLVSTDKTTGLKSVSYGRLTSVITKAIQEQQQTIDALKKINEDLVKRLEAIEKLLLK